MGEVTASAPFSRSVVSPASRKRRCSSESGAARVSHSAMAHSRAGWRAANASPT
jgi:hypothetical protein